MRRGLITSSLPTLLAWLGAAGIVVAQPPADGSLPPVFAETMPHVPAALGNFSHEISTPSPEAQAFFDQGFQLMYAFGKYEAVRSFREAWRRDPDCAMCYWGEAWAWGSYLNVPMADWEAPHAYAAMQKALGLRDHATPRERDYIDALSARYVADFDFDARREQDEAYAQAMHALAAKYPDDLDAATLYADALFLLIPRRGYRDLEAPEVVRLLGVLEGVLAVDIRRPGACHLYVHATESTVDPGRAEPCAEFRDAERIYREELEDHPHNGWSLLGLKAALEAQGETVEDVAADLAESWARADVWIVASRF